MTSHVMNTDWAITVNINEPMYSRDGTLFDMIHPGMCQTPHQQPISRVDVRALNLTWSRGSANPRQPSSSPVAPVKMIIIASPISDGKLYWLSGPGGFPPKRRYTPVSAKTTTTGETAARYHHRLALHFVQPPNNLRTPDSSLRTNAMTMIADILGDHVARSPKIRNCDAEYTSMNKMCNTRESAKKTRRALPLQEATFPSSDIPQSPCPRTEFLFQS
ncbi:MAG: hypothetical protein PVH79_00580 [Candidatus Bathyarchaeota archaeon]